MVENDVSQIKAGVAGMLDDVPAPSAPAQDMPPATSSMGEAPVAPPATSYEGFEQSYQTGSSVQPYGAEPLPSGGVDTEAVHQVAESIINERWDDFLGSVGNISLFKDRTERELVSVKQELVRMQERFTQIESAMLGKVAAYEQDIKGVHTEMKALEKVFERILEPLVSNIKELGVLTNELKGLQRKKP